MKRRAVPLFISTVVASVAACNRAEPDRPPAATAASHAEVIAPKASATEAPAPPKHCIAKLASDPPPHEKKAASCPRDPGGLPEPARGSVAFVEAPGAPRISIEIASTPAWHERGLMYRTAMPDDQGMLFSWDDESVRTFWMHDTCIPLDMLYVAKDGTIVGVLEEVPAMNDTPRAVPCPAAHVLEVNAGYTRAHGIAPGQRLKIET